MRGRRGRIIGRGRGRERWWRSQLDNCGDRRPVACLAKPAGEKIEQSGNEQKMAKVR